MSMLRTTVGIAALFSSLAPSTALAITLPDTGTCSSGPCLTITANSGWSMKGIGQYGGVWGVGNWVGVRGDSDTGIGVLAESNSGVGVHASSTSSDGVRAYSSNARAAAVSAIASSSTARAYWGTGYIEITGTAYKPGGGAWNSSSDARVKKDVKPLEWSVDQLRAVRPVKFKYNGLGACSFYG